MSCKKVIPKSSLRPQLAPATHEISGLKPAHQYTIKPDKAMPIGFNSEKVGFEPTVQVAPHNTLAGCRLKPLGHFSSY